MRTDIELRSKGCAGLRLNLRMNIGIVIVFVPIEACEGEGRNAFVKETFHITSVQYPSSNRLVVASTVQTKKE